MLGIVFAIICAICLIGALYEDMPIFTIVVVCSIVFGCIVKLVSSIKSKRKRREEEVREIKRREEEKKRREEEERKKREAEAERNRIAKEQLEHFCRGLPTNPIITTAVPAVAVQCAREMVLEQATNPYQKRSFRVYAGVEGISVAEQYIPYAQYGLSSISDDYMRYELAKKAAEVFHQTLRNELTALNTRCRTDIKHITYDRRAFNPEYTVTCEIGFADSISW